MAAPMICGGVYEFTQQDGRVEHGLMLSTTEDQQGRITGMIAFVGHAPERVRAETARWSQMKLIGRPASPNVGRPRKG